MILPLFNPVLLMIQGRFQIPSPVQLHFETELEIHLTRSMTLSCFQEMSRFVQKMGNGLALEILNNFNR